MNFYPLITSKLLDDALKFAAKYVNISPEDRDIILHAKQSLLYDENDAWIKRQSTNCFDVTMGSFDGAETCELVGTYLLNQLPKKIRDSVGLYRDDGLGAFKETPRQIEQIKKQICKTFSNNNLKITIEANKKVVDFLDVTLDLNKGTYEPYIKPNNTPLYVHRESNHPPSIIKNIPIAINRRINETSSNREAFEKVAPTYQQALNKSGYEFQLNYQEPATPTTPRPNKKNRHRNITWFNPPYSNHVKTNLGRKFLNIVKQCFTPDHPLKKIFNKNTLKLSYSCMPNLEKKISAHNKKLLTTLPETPDKMCNCRKPAECPLDGKCLTPNVIYQATVECEGGQETYIGLTENQFKTRYRNHTSSFKNENKRNATELSKHIWDLKDNNKQYKTTWKIIARANPYSNASKICNLCLTEKFFIICKPQLCTLNKRNELASSCRHAAKFLLRNT